MNTIRDFITTAQAYRDWLDRQMKPTKRYDFLLPPGQAEKFKKELNLQALQHALYRLKQVRKLTTAATAAPPQKRKRLPTKPKHL
jgi:hypothetical protein